MRETADHQRPKADFIFPPSGLGTEFLVFGINVVFDDPKFSADFSL
jgi:hypothetical protein